MQSYGRDCKSKANQAYLASPLRTVNAGSTGMAGTEQPAVSDASTARPRRLRSRLSDGRQLLKGVHSQSAWARLYRDKYDALVAHCGGEDQITEPQRMRIRRICTLETELCFQESDIAATRANGETPEAD